MAPATMQAPAAEATVNVVTMEGMTAEPVVMKSVIKISANESADANAAVRAPPAQTAHGQSARMCKSRLHCEKVGTLSMVVRAHRGSGASRGCGTTLMVGAGFLRERSFVHVLVLPALPN